MRHVFRLAVLWGVFSTLVWSQWSSVGRVDSVGRPSGGTIEFIAGAARVRLTFLADDLVRVRAVRHGIFGPDRSIAVAKREWEAVAPEFTPGTDSILFATRRMSVVVRRSPLRIVVRDSSGAILCEDHCRGMAWDGSGMRVWKKRRPGEQFFGLGEKAGVLNRTGKAFVLWNTDIPAYKADTDPLYQSIPFFFSICRGAAYGIFFDNTYRSSFDFGVESPDAYSFGATGGDIDYYVFTGSSPRSILERFTELVGRMPMPPRWALGYQQCRWSYAPESKVRSIARMFRQKKIPCDVLYLDIDYMDGYRVFTWSPRNFPDPKKLLSDLASEGFKVVTIVDPGIKADSSYDVFESGLKQDVFLKYPDGRLYLGKVWPGVCAFPDFTSSRTRTWWGKNYRFLLEAGVRGFWNDMNEPSVFDVPTKTVELDVVHDDEGYRTPHTKNHNTYGLLMTQGTYDGVRALRPGERPFVLTRASFAGGQRYAAAWTGDNVSSWEHLQMAVPMCLGLSISGQPFVGTDIGGFIGTPDGELFARWLQLGVFTPLMRAHSVINSPDKEPWTYGTAYEAVNRATIELRYRLLPYIYNVMHAASETGVPPMRPLIFDYPADDSFILNDTDFLFGEDLLVAPVLRPGEREREVRLPAGHWYDYWTDQGYDGGREIRVPAPIDRIPIFVKSGAIIPTQQVVQYVDQAPVDPLTLTVYPADSSTSTYYADDGISFEYQRGGYIQRTLTQQRSDRSIRLTLSRASGSYPGPVRYVNIRFVGVQASPVNVAVSGRLLARFRRLPKTEGWTYDARGRSLLVRVKDSTQELAVAASMAP